MKNSTFEYSNNIMEVKEEDPSSVDLASQKGRVLTKVATMKTNSDAVFLDVDCDVAIKSEDSSVCPTKHVESEMFTSSNNGKVGVKTEMEEQILGLDFGSQSEREILAEDCILKDEKYDSDQGVDCKIEIKEEPCWLDTGSSSACDDIKDVDIPPVNSSRLTSQKPFPDGGFSSSPPKPVLGGQYQKGEAVTSSEEAGMSVDMILHKCNTCNRSFKRESYLNRHILLHSNPRQYKCDRCEKHFKRKSYLKQHIVFHSEIRPYKCDRCDKSYKEKHSLERHVLSHSEIRPFKCYICEKSYKEKHSLKRHVLSHSDTRPYKCYICEKSFKQKYNLDQHILVHSDTRPYKCDRCEKSFKGRFHLEQHVVFHSDIRPYKCDICDKYFKRKYSLDRHIQDHSDIRPYKCDVCDKCFKQKCNLYKHVLSHSDSRPYKCDVCEKYYRQKSHLNRHIKLH